jgi:hypothetical protein
MNDLAQLQEDYTFTYFTISRLKYETYLKVFKIYFLLHSEHTALV